MTEKIKKLWPIGKLKNWRDNPRGISKKGFERLKKQIQRFGQIKPLIVCQGSKALPDGTVLGGNMRLKAHQELGTKELWISPVAPKSKAEALEIALTDNDRAGFYEEDVLAELAHGLDIDFNDYGIDLREPFSLDDLISNYAPDNEKDDEVPESPKNPKSKLGDLYILGDHRLMCGDSTNKEDVEKLMAGEKADMVFTDPPYGVDYGEKNRFLNSFQKAGRNLKDIANDMLGKDELLDFLTKAFTLACEHGADHCSYYVTAPQGGELGLMMMMMMMMMSGLPTKHVLIWNKNRQNFSLGRLDYEYKHEPILFTWKKTHNFYGNGQFKSSVWDIAKELKCALHPTMKPVALIENALLNSTEARNICLDLFGGSGSTLIACEKLHRKCRMMEIDPIYVDVIVERWQTFTGKKAKKE